MWVKITIIQENYHQFLTCPKSAKWLLSRSSHPRSSHLKSSHRRSSKITLYLLQNKIHQFCKLLSKIELINFFFCKKSCIQSKKISYAKKWNSEKKKKKKTQILICKKSRITKHTKFWRLKKFKLLKFTQ